MRKLTTSEAAYPFLTHLTLCCEWRHRSAHAGVCGTAAAFVQKVRDGAFPELRELALRSHTGNAQLSFFVPHACDLVDALAVHSPHLHTLDLTGIALEEGIFRLVTQRIPPGVDCVRLSAPHAPSDAWTTPTPSLELEMLTQVSATELTTLLRTQPNVRDFVLRGHKTGSTGIPQSTLGEGGHCMVVLETLHLERVDFAYSLLLWIPKLRVLTLEDCGDHPVAAWTLLSLFPTLEELQLRVSDHNDDDPLAVIEPTCEHLHLRKLRVRASSRRAGSAPPPSCRALHDGILARCPNLEALHLDPLRGIDVPIAPLSHLRLRTLTIKNCVMQKTDTLMIMLFNAFLPALTELDVSLPALTGLGQVLNAPLPMTNNVLGSMGNGLTERMPNVTRFAMSYVVFLSRATFHAFQAVFERWPIVHLSFRGIQVPLINIANTLSHTLDARLRSLDLSAMGLDLRGFSKALSQCRCHYTLEELDVGYNCESRCMGDIFIANLSMPRLRVLRMEGMSKPLWRACYETHIAHALENDDAMPCLRVLTIHGDTFETRTLTPEWYDTDLAKVLRRRKISILKDELVELMDA